jgi:hypothetical protein
VIEDRKQVKAGATLVGRHHGKEHTCRVVETSEGLRFRLAGGETFGSPSGAAKHVLGCQANGWAWWSVHTKADAAVKESRADGQRRRRAAAKAKRGG